MAQRVRTDWILFWTIILLVCFGLVMVFSSSAVMAELKYGKKEQVGSLHFVSHQLGWAVASFFVLMYCKRKDYRSLKSPVLAFGSLGVVLALLVAVYFFDKDAHRWFRFPMGSIQPSEFAKPALILFLAYFLTRRPDESINNRHNVRQAALVLGFLSLAVVIADLGTAVVLIATAFVVMFAAGLNRRYCAIALLVALMFGGAAVAVKPYRLARVFAFTDKLIGAEPSVAVQLDPSGRLVRYITSSEKTRDAHYQVQQSEIAVGSGGLLGLGLGAGKQKWLFLPEAHTDFIYAIVGEELGLAGCTFILIGFVVILWRGVRLYWTAPDDYGRYLALGVTACIVIQAMFNMSVVLGMGPTKGIPLPMISNGGSSLLSTLTCLGILLSVSEQSA